jgi:hypothetical protein
MADPIRIQGLSEFRRAYRQVQTDAPKQLRSVMNDAMNIVVGWAQPRVPRRTGRAAASLRAKSTGSKARIAGGSRRVPYYPWLDFGGRVGARRQVVREFRKDGRYIYAGYFAKKDEIVKALQGGMVKLANGVGWDVKP